MATWGLSFVTRQPVWDELAGRSSTPCRCRARHDFAIVFGIARGGRRVAARTRLRDWGGVDGVARLLLDADAVARLMLLIVFAGVLPRCGHLRPLPRVQDPSWWQTVVDRLRAHDPARAHARARALRRVRADHALRDARDARRGLHHDRAGEGLPQLDDRPASTALRNALLPIMTLIALSLGFLVGGAILVEAVFSYPGIGLVTTRRSFDRDYPVLQGAFLILTSPWSSPTSSPTSSTSSSTRGSARHERHSTTARADRRASRRCSHRRGRPASGPCSRSSGRIRARCVGLAIIVFFVLIAIFAPVHRAVRRARARPATPYEPPSSAHWLGTRRRRRRTCSRS